MRLQLVSFAVVVLLATQATAGKPTPPIECGSNVSPPSNSPLCIYVFNNASAFTSDFTLSGSGAVNTSFVSPPPASWSTDLWFSVHDGEYWPNATDPNGHLAPFKAFAKYTFTSPKHPGDVLEFDVTEVLTGAYDTSFAIPPPFTAGAFGGPDSPAGQNPFVIALVINTN